MAEDWKPLAGDKKRVVVVGAGIAGLTAAHELCERGYEVEVVERQRNVYPHLTGCVVGGMARTTWATIPAPPDQYPLAPRTPPFTALRADVGPAPVFLDTSEDELRRQVKDFVDHVPAHAVGPLALTVFGPRNDSRIDAVQKQLDTLKRAYETTYSGAEQRFVIQLAIRETLVPGEHGFRFFPSFYRHMFETMKRIPIEEAAISQGPFSGVAVGSDSSRTVFDALRSADDMELGLRRDAAGARSFAIERHPMRSVEEIRTLLVNVLERAGYRGQDLYRLATRYLEYLTSSPERRRAEYEHLPWAEFLGLGRGYSEYFVGHVNSGAQALVAMTSTLNDARTLGSVALQLTLDQLRANPSGYTDATLRGPTSVALFAPWRAYLESQRVKFTYGELVGFTAKRARRGRGPAMATRPVFAQRDGASASWLAVAPADYYVIAIPVDRFQRLYTASGEPAIQIDGGPPLITAEQLERANELCLELDAIEQETPELELADRNDVHKLLSFPINDFVASPDAGPFRYMVGIQFFFSSDVKLFLGHSVGLDSPWGVSYISQAQYWQTRERGQSGSRGVLSAIFTRFEQPAPGRNGAAPKAAKDCTALEIADRVWAQIVSAWDREANGELPEPLYFFLDDNLERVDGRWRNASPYLVNHVGDWERRGGSRKLDGDYVYPIQLGHTVFAGAFMRTFTRLNTMEAANESGRRAVNAILERDRATCQRSPIYNLEDVEVPALRTARDLDARIWKRGGSHPLQHSAVEMMLRMVPWDLVRLGLPPNEDGR